MKTRGIYMNINLYKGSFSLVHKDILKNEPILHMVGINRVDIENHRGIIEYTDEKLRVDTKIGLVIIKGRNLLISEIDKYTISVFGKIKNIEYTGGS